jgi:thymidylate synthase
MRYVNLDGESADWVFRRVLRITLDNGAVVRPRGLETREMFHQTTVVDLRRPLITHPARRLNYAFAAAEALWILDGSNDLARLTRVNAEMARYSDDGLTLSGAYGPRIAEQLGYVLRTLAADPASRQAVVTIWRENPAPSKDIPCTVALAFYLRDGTLHVHAFMRSNDLWRGWPYDTFSFSMLSVVLAHRLGARPGNLYLTAGSSHLYATDFDAARAFLSARDGPGEAEATVPEGISEAELRRSLALCADRVPFDGEPRRWRVRPAWSEARLVRRGP